MFKIHCANELYFLIFTTMINHLILHFFLLNRTPSSSGSNSYLTTKTTLHSNHKDPQNCLKHISKNKDRFSLLQKEYRSLSRLDNQKQPTPTLGASSKGREISAASFYKLSRRSQWNKDKLFWWANLLPENLSNFYQLICDKSSDAQTHQVLRMHRKVLKILINNWSKTTLILQLIKKLITF